MGREEERDVMRALVVLAGAGLISTDGFRELSVVLLTKDWTSR